MLPDVGSTIVPPGFSRPSRLGRVDHGDGQAVLDAAAGVRDLDLGEQVALQALGLDQPRQPHERRVADQIEDRVGDVHRRGRITWRVTRHASTLPVGRLRVARPDRVPIDRLRFHHRARAQTPGGRDLLR